MFSMSTSWVLSPSSGKKTSQVGIASVWYQGNPCNMHLLSLGEDVKKEVDKDAIWRVFGIHYPLVNIQKAIENGHL